MAINRAPSPASTISPTKSIQQPSARGSSVSPAGLRAGDALKLATIASLHEGLGIGRALVAAAEAEARRLGLPWIVPSTTNDKLRALAFYQRAGFVLAALHSDAVARLRALKPAIPAVAGNGIPIRVSWQP